jgi:hypothetical protein
VEEEEEDDLEISFKPSSITTFLPFPPVDSSAHLLNARSAKVGTYSQRREIGTISDLDIRLFKFLLKLSNSITHELYIAFKCTYSRNRDLLLEGIVTHQTALTVTYQDLQPKHCLVVQIAKNGGINVSKAASVFKIGLKRHKNLFLQQCYGSVTFLYGSGFGSSDPYL